MSMQGGPPQWQPPGNAPQPPGYGPPPAYAQQPYGPGYGAPQPPKPPWYYQTPFLALSFFCCWPAGLTLIWLSPLATRTMKILASVFAVLAVIAFAIIGSSNLPKTSSTPAAQPVATPQVTATVERAAPKPQPKLNEPFKLGSFTYTILAVEVGDKVGKGYSVKKASEGASFVVVKYKLRNEGNETETVMTDDFKIVDAKGRQFRPSSEANTALAMSGEDKDLILSEVQPGLTKSMATAFEVPSDVAEGGFELVIPEKGMLGTGEVRIALR